MSDFPRFPRTLTELVRICVASRGDAGAFLVHRDGRWAEISGAEAFQLVRRLGAALAARGIEPGDRVAILSWNRAEWLLADLAITSVGAVTVPIYPNLPYGQAGAILEHSGTRIVIAENAGQFEKATRARASCPAIEDLVVIDRWGLPGEVRDLASLADDGEVALRADAALWDRRADAVEPGDLATLIYTSGTTGTPKGVMLTHENLCENVAGCLRRLRILPSDLAISFLPLAHVFERTVELIYLVAGARIAYARSIEGLGEDLLEVSPTVMATVPRVLEKIRARVHQVVSGMPGPLERAARWAMEVGALRGDRVREGRRVGPWLALRWRLADILVARRVREQLGGRMRAVISGGAALSPEVARFFWGAGVPVLEGYGLTETAPVIGVNPPDRCRLGTIGPPLDNVRVEIASDGEVLVRGPSVSGGYWEAPELTAESFRDGWFHTGDLGRLDEAGYLSITGRKKEILVTSGGKNVAPVRVESLLQESELIERAVVVGDGRPYLVALLVLAPGAAERIADEEGLDSLEGRDLLDHPAVQERVRREIDRLQAGLASYETVKRFRLLDEDLSVEAGLLTPTLKVRRREVDRAYGDDIHALYA